MAITGKEDGVLWNWTNNLQFSLNRGDVNVSVNPHPIHSLDVSALGGNQFYGSFSIVLTDGTTYHRPNHILANPTKTDHTEPQYFDWLQNEIHGGGVTLGLLRNPAVAFIIEINQTNTPCSKATCRKAILNCVKDRTVAGVPFGMVVARMSAYQIYESQYPKICPTSIEIATGKKSTAVPVVMESQCLHRFPEA